MTEAKFDVPIQILVTRDQQGAIKAAAARAGMKLSDYIRQAIREKLRREQEVTR